jgi:hypothetical protein
MLLTITPTMVKLMIDGTDDDTLGLEQLSEYQDVISQRAMAFCNVAKLADSMQDQTVKDLCLTMMRKLTATIRTPSTGELHVINDKRD